MSNWWEFLGVGQYAEYMTEFLKSPLMVEGRRTRRGVVREVRSHRPNGLATVRVRYCERGTYTISTLILLKTDWQSAKVSTRSGRDSNSGVRYWLDYTNLTDCGDRDEDQLMKTNLPFDAVAGI